MALAAKGLETGDPGCRGPEHGLAVAARGDRGRAQSVPIQDSLADGLSGNIAAGSITVDLACRHVDEVVLVEEAEIAAAMRTVLEHEHVLVEGSAAVTVAALQTGLLAGGRAAGGAAADRPQRRPERAAERVGRVAQDPVANPLRMFQLPNVVMIAS